MRLAIATRSMNPFLYQRSGELLGLEPGSRSTLRDFRRYGLTGTDNFGYFRELLKIDADWVVNLDEDAFVLRPDLLLGLVRQMESEGYAACGMPDGGVVRIRYHNPAACNAFFNVFDMRRVRPVWENWERVKAATHQPEYESRVASFAKRTPFVFDHFERYYGVFFSLLDVGERILYLDAEEWQDRVSTLLRTVTGEALLIHCWYTRNWDFSQHTRQRYRAVIDHARQAQGLGPFVWGESEPAGQPAPPPASKLGKWEPAFQNAREPYPFGDTLTYQKAAVVLKDLSQVEDWGCGLAWFKRYLPSTIRYKGIDGSHSEFVDEVADLTAYSSQVEGILLRHVLEHNEDWATILRNAIRSFTRKLVLVLFTPFSDVTRIINYNASMAVPDISFARTDLIRVFVAVNWSLEENLRTNTQYGVEHLFYLEKQQ
jgi:hypothetical protein